MRSERTERAHRIGNRALNNGEHNDPAKSTHAKMAFPSRPFCPCSKQQIQACIGIRTHRVGTVQKQRETHSGREQCNCSTAMACSALSSPCSRCSAAHLRPAFKRQKASCQVEPTIHAGLDLGLQCHRRSTRSLIVVERTRSGKERKWHLSSRKKARLDAGAMACQHEPSAAESSRRPRAEDAMDRRCVDGDTRSCGEGPSSA